jgi:hypothetical protein
LRISIGLAQRQFNSFHMPFNRSALWLGSMPLRVMLRACGKRSALPFYRVFG